MADAPWGGGCGITLSQQVALYGPDRTLRSTGESENAVGQSVKGESMCRVLVVEDETIIAMELTYKLRAMGITAVDVADCAGSALHCVRQRPVDVVFMDVYLAGRRDGIEAAQAIRGICPVPVVFVSASSDRATAQRASEVGGVAFLTKPVEDADLREVLNRFCASVCASA